MPRDGFREPDHQPDRQRPVGLTCSKTRHDYHLEQTPLSDLERQQASSIAQACNRIHRAEEAGGRAMFAPTSCAAPRKCRSIRRPSDNTEAAAEARAPIKPMPPSAAREIASVRALDESETSKIQSEERTKSETTARRLSDRPVRLQAGELQREKEVAENQPQARGGHRGRKGHAAPTSRSSICEKSSYAARHREGQCLDVHKRHSDVIPSASVVERTWPNKKKAIKNCAWWPRPTHQEVGR